MTASGMLLLRGSKRVRGPGQKAVARCEMRDARFAGMVVMVGRSAAEARWTMRGSQEGRCLAAKILAIASGERALAPRP